MRFRDLPKLHGEDPSGFWKLIRTGKELPQVDELILYVEDIRGTSAECQHDLLVSISGGDKYHVHNKAVERGEKSCGVRAVDNLIAEVFKLPTTGARPITRVGVVESVDFDETSQEWFIQIVRDRNVYKHQVSSEHIIYWAPYPLPADTYVEREGDFQDIYWTSGLYRRETDARERWQRRHRGRLKS